MLPNLEAFLVAKTSKIKQFHNHNIGPYRYYRYPYIIRTQNQGLGHCYSHKLKLKFCVLKRPIFCCKKVICSAKDKLRFKGNTAF